MLTVKNYNKFQHFKDRRPPWIKLYRDLLDDLEWHDLEPGAAKALVMIWLIASENEGKLPEPKKLAFRLRLSDTEMLHLLRRLSHWLVQDDNGPISTCHQVDIPEKEVETEYRAETETESEQSRGGAGDAPASRAKPRSARRPTVCDEQWLLELQTNPAYQTLDVKALYHKMVVWCQNKGKQPTRGRLINWLNREDKPMTAPQNGGTNGRYQVPRNETYGERTGRQMEELFADSVAASFGDSGPNSADTETPWPALNSGGI